MGEARWELFSHKADMGIRGYGPNFETAFEQAGLALTAVLTDPQEITPQTQVQVVCEAPTLDMLFYDWINELVYAMAYQHLIFSRFHVKINQNALRGEAWGEPIDPAKHHLAVEVKGATFTELKAEETLDEGCLVQCVVDI